MGAWGRYPRKRWICRKKERQKKPAGTGGVFSRAWLHFGRAALERPLLERFDRSVFPLYRPFSRLLLRCSAERGFSLQAGRCGQYKDIVSLSFPRFFEYRTGNWPRAERRRFPADKGEAFRLCRPFSRAPDGRFLRRSSFCPHRRFPVSGGKSPLWGKRRQK